MKTTEKRHKEERLRYDRTERWRERRKDERKYGKYPRKIKFIKSVEVVLPCHIRLNEAARPWS